MQFQGVGAPSWVLEPRNGLARGIFRRLVADDRFPGKQFSIGVLRHHNALLSGGGRSAYQMVFGSNAVDLFGWGDGKDEDLICAHGTSP